MFRAAKALFLAAFLKQQDCSNFMSVTTVESTFIINRADLVFLLDNTLLNFRLAVLYAVLYLRQLSGIMKSLAVLLPQLPKQILWDSTSPAIQLAQFVALCPVITKNGRFVAEYIIRFDTVFVHIYSVRFLYLYFKVHKHYSRFHMSFVYKISSCTFIMCLPSE